MSTSERNFIKCAKMRKSTQFWAKYGVFKAQYLTKEASYDLSDTFSTKI